MIIIPITSDTLELVTKLNDGVEPTLEPVKTFFVYDGPNRHSQIVSESNEFWTDPERGWKMLPVYYHKW